MIPCKKLIPAVVREHEKKKYDEEKGWNRAPMLLLRPRGLLRVVRLSGIHDETMQQRPRSDGISVLT